MKTTRFLVRFVGIRGHLDIEFSPLLTVTFERGPNGGL